MAWEIISKTQASEYARYPANNINDLWYDIVVGLVESHTGWESLNAVADPRTDTFSGLGSSFLPLAIPLVSVSSLKVLGVELPASYYKVRWDGIELSTYRPQQVIVQAPYFDIFTQYGSIFPFGTNNIEATFTYGGYENLPRNLQTSLQGVMLMIIKEFTVMPRNEGSDQIMKAYKSGLHTDEALKKAGMHGKISGILADFMPMRARWA